MKLTRASIAFTLLIGCLMVGCAPATPPPVPVIAAPAPLQIDDWTVNGAPGCRVTSPHYLVYSTVPDRQLLVRIGQLMEGALSAYRSIAPDVPPSDRPMECYLFANRTQWAAFTKDHT